MNKQEYEKRTAELAGALAVAASNEAFARVTASRATSILSESQDEYEKHLASKPEETENVESQE